MSQHRFAPERGDDIDRGDKPRGPNGRRLCRRCAVEVPRDRRTFCSDACVHEWKMRSQAAYVREQVLRRDGGICAACGADTLPETIRAKMATYPHWAARSSGAFWQADHIVPVCEGGGLCGLDGYRTLCTACHKRATAALAATRAIRRRDERRPLLGGAEVLG